MKYIYIVRFDFAISIFLRINPQTDQKSHWVAPRARYIHHLFKKSFLWEIKFDAWYRCKPRLHRWHSRKEVVCSHTSRLKIHILESQLAFSIFCCFFTWFADHNICLATVTCNGGWKVDDDEVSTLYTGKEWWSSGGDCDEEKDDYDDVAAVTDGERKRDPTVGSHLRIPPKLESHLKESKGRLGGLCRV